MLIARRVLCVHQRDATILSVDVTDESGERELRYQELQKGETKYISTLLYSRGCHLVERT
jgi:hypothetical protein